MSAAPLASPTTPPPSRRIVIHRDVYRDSGGHPIFPSQLVQYRDVLSTSRVANTVPPQRGESESSNSEVERHFAKLGAGRTLGGPQEQHHYLPQQQNVQTDVNEPWRSQPTQYTSNVDIFHAGSTLHHDEGFGIIRYPDGSHEIDYGGGHKDTFGPGVPPPERVSHGTYDASQGQAITAWTVPCWPDEEAERSVAN